MNVQDLIKLPTDSEQPRSTVPVEGTTDPEGPDFSDVMASIDGTQSTFPGGEEEIPTLDIGPEIANEMSLEVATGDTEELPNADTLDIAYLTQETTENPPAGEPELAGEAAAALPPQNVATETFKPANNPVVEPQITQISNMTVLNGVNSPGHSISEVPVVANDTVAKEMPPIKAATVEASPLIKPPQSGLERAEQAKIGPLQVAGDEADSVDPRFQSEIRMEKSEVTPPRQPVENFMQGARPSAISFQANLPQQQFAEMDAPIMHDKDMGLATEIDAIRAKDILRPSPIIPVADPRMARAVMNQISASLKTDDAGAIEIRLDPPELGRVALHVSPVDGGHVANVVADRPEILDLLRRHEALLAQELKDAGFGALSFSFSQQNGASDDGSPAQHFAAANGDLATPLESEGQAPIPMSTGQRLDIRL